MKEIKAYMCSFGCGKYLRSKSGMRKHEKACYWNPATRSCASCGNQERGFRGVSNPNHGGNPGSTDYEKKVCRCIEYNTDLFNPGNLRTGCEGWVKVMTLKEACEIVGAAICEFPPDDDPCETCGEPYKQLYYIRTCYEVDEGEYYCAECIKEIPALWKDIADGYAKMAEELEPVTG